jgi:hypothetical protein
MSGSSTTNADVRSASLATRQPSPNSAAKRIVRIGLVTLALLAIALPLAAAHDTRASSRRSDPAFSGPRLVRGPGTVVFFSYRDPAGRPDGRLKTPSDSCSLRHNQFPPRERGK